MTASGQDIWGGHGGTCSLNPVPWSALAAVLMGLATFGCATAGSNKSVSGAAASSGFAIVKPKLQHCDELACYYSSFRHYYIRELRCPEGAAAPVICEYERAETDSPDPELSLDTKRRLGIAKPGEVEVPLTWKKARSTLSRSKNGWWRIDADADE